MLHPYTSDRLYGKLLFRVEHIEKHRRNNGAGKKNPFAAIILIINNSRLEWGSGIQCLFQHQTKSSTVNDQAEVTTARQS